MKTTYGKLNDGTWGLRCEGGVPGVGTSVVVTKKDGSTKSEVVGSILWQGTTKSGNPGALCTIADAPGASRREPLSVDGRPAIRGQHWSQRGHGPEVRLCAGGCGRRVSPRCAECYSCSRESLEAM